MAPPGEGQKPRLVPANRAHVGPEHNVGPAQCSFLLVLMVYDITPIF